MEENKFETKEEKKKANLKPILMKSLFILMIVVIIVILAFSIIRFIPMVFSSFASVGSLIKSPFEKGLVLKVNETDLNSGETFRLYFEYEPEEAGYYNLSFECAPDLSLAVANQENGVLECARKYRIAPNDKFIDLKATLAKENFYTETNIQVSYLNKEQKEIVSDTITISVVNETNLSVSDLSGSATISSQNVGGTSGSVTDTSDSAKTSTTNTYTPTYTTPTYTQTYASSIPADLRITNARSIGDTIVLFDVSNIGGKATGNWYFSYVIPNESLETSPLQMSLNPGDSMRFTLRFEDTDSGNTVITLDPKNYIRENSEYNNSATVYVRGNSSENYSYDYNDYDDYDDDYDRNDDADLVIKNLEVGRMNGSRFVEDNEIDEDDEAAVRFIVVNIGGESTGTWRFEIDNTPYDGSNNDYRSGRQSSLRPGESEEFVIEFDNPDEGSYRIKVTVDSDDDVDEEKENNNDDSKTLEVEK